MSGSTHQAHGGNSAEQRRAFSSGIVAASLADVPWDCQCEWSTRGSIPNIHWALKYTSGACPVSDHIRAHQQG